jgi:hypothetical protein
MIGWVTISGMHDSGGGAHVRLYWLSSRLLPLLLPHKDEGQIFPLNLPDTATLIAILVSQDTVKPISVVNVSHFTLGLIILNPKVITYIG